jgi:F-type H+-transporting ATPase subunit b
VLPATAIPLAASGSFLISPNVGLMVWTIVVFLISLFILRKWVFPLIGEALDKRAETIAGDIDAAEVLRQDAEKLLAEYRERLHEARGQADDIVKRARTTADAHEQEAREHAQVLTAEGKARAEREIAEATRRALAEIRTEVAKLTILAAEKVTRKSLDESDQRRLVEEALGELDFSAIASTAPTDAANN